ncbi:MAG: hypothetical protein QOF63_265 [Thermoanaerobaculia bacterium]|jgi:hypothetical protein|nr:hypothetical protein [Thermoanaerobaculia bacterium]
MEGFILRIFFSGLIAFVPSTDGKELTVLLVNTPHQYALAGGTTLAHHRAMVLGRGGRCEGDCVTNDHQSIAEFFFANLTQSQAVRALNQTIGGGGAWEVAGADLTLTGPREPLAVRTGVRRAENGTPHAVPATPEEREDFSWVPSLKEILPSTGGLKQGLTGKKAPPPGLVVARLRLRSGKVFTYSVINVDAKARPIHFRASENGTEAPYSQALANWVEAEIHVPGDVVEIIEKSFSDPKRTRSMKLHPEQGLVEMAVVNLPPFVAPSPDAARPAPAPGQHFQAFYLLAKTPPAAEKRLVPHLALEPLASDPQVDWAPLHPRVWSELLEQLGMAPRGKGPYDLTLCPMIRE